MIFWLHLFKGIFQELSLAPGYRPEDFVYIHKAEYAGNVGYILLSECTVA